MSVAIVAGAVAILVAVLTPAFTAAADQRLRRREVLAAAVGALVAYREYPYVIRRRNGDDPAGERLRITSEVMKVQREIAEATVWIEAEAEAISRAYAVAAEDHRRIAGRLMNEAWATDPPSSDADMNIPDLHEQLAHLRVHDAELARLIKQEVRFRWNPFA